MTIESKDLTRSQMLGMIASLRAAVYSLLHGHPEDVAVDREDAQRILDETAGNASEEDLIDGSFDKSWSPTYSGRR